MSLSSQILLDNNFMSEYNYRDPRCLEWTLENKYPSLQRQFLYSQMQMYVKDFPLHHVSRANEFGLDLRLLSQSKQMNERIIGESLERPTRTYNCWGFVAAMKEWREDLIWLDCQDMERYLAKHLLPVQIKPCDAQKGDVAVYHAWGCLHHTALCLGNGMLIHKPGPLPLETVSFEELYERHGYCYGPLTYIGREQIK